jgi:uracil-DNA glycosylase family 4
MAFDPRTLGAKCDLCPLNGNKPVPSEQSQISALEILSGRKAHFAIVGEAPGEVEEAQGRPFVGPSGSELEKALRAAGARRGDALITNTIACRPPENDIGGLLRKISKLNKERDADNQIASPIDCCKPRLDAELKGYENFITLGATATRALTGSAASILAVRGGLQDFPATDELPAKKVMPTVHPAFVLRAQRWAHVFRNDVYKALRWFLGKAEWQPPHVTLNPSLLELMTFLSQDHLFAYDLETDGIEPLTAKIRCVGVGTTEKVVIVGLLGKDGFTRFYPPDEEAQVIALLKQFFTDEKITKFGHNSGSYDRMVLESQWGITPKPNLDTILLHRCVESELPHSLAFVGSMYTSAPSWKTDRSGNKLSTGAESDTELFEYCATDVAITAAVLPPLAEQVRLRDQVQVWRLDQKIQEVCVAMHTVGMFVDQKVRLEEEKRLLALRYKTLETLRARLRDLGFNRTDFNPGSIYHLRDLLFGKWHLQPPLEDEEDRWTAGGDKSTGDLILRAILTQPEVAEGQREAIKLIRKYRKTQKLIGTYVTKLRFNNIKPDSNDYFSDLGWDEDEEDSEWMADSDIRKRYGTDRRGIVVPGTGRMHPGYNAHVANTGRLSSSRPLNAQNVPRTMRRMVSAAPGHVLVGADMDQLELRIAAARWQVEIYLRAFEEGKDPHSMTAYAAFGEAFCQAAGLDALQLLQPGRFSGSAYDGNGKFIGKGDAKKMRDLAKIIQYACAAKGTKVAVIGGSGAKSIEELEVGKDVTYSWIDGRFAPALVKAKRCNGEKSCVRVHFGWRTALGTVERRSEVFTKDHLFLLRDGTFRAAGALLAGDRLMPFRRSVTEANRDPAKTAQIWESRRANGKDGTRQRKSVLDVYREHIGTLPDSQVATMAGCTPEAVAYYRKTRNIPAPDTDYGKKRLHLMALKEKLGVLSDQSIADAVGCDRTSVQQLRIELGIKKASRAGEKRESKLDPWSVRIGHEADSVIAQEAGVTPEAVAYFRKSRGIPAYWKMPEGGTNHEVLLVEEAGVQEVWDIEVDHEGHTFALESGIFVHNSQYEAAAETVHQVVTRTEVEKADGTTELPYALQPLRKTRELQEKWLAGAPEFKSGWESEMRLYRKQGYIREPVTGRRRDFMDGENPCEISNFPIQSSAAGLMNLAILPIHEAIPLHKWGPGTGIINQCHDSIVVECPEDKAEYVKGILEEFMNQTHDKLPRVVFSASADIGPSWDKV